MNLTENNCGELGQGFSADITVTKQYTLQWSHVEALLCYSDMSCRTILLQLTISFFWIQVDYKLLDYGVVVLCIKCFLKKERTNDTLFQDGTP